MSRSPTKLTRAQEDAVADFVGITGAQIRQARSYIEKYKRLDAAIDAYYSNPPSAPSRGAGGGPSTTKINALFDKYKDPEPLDPNADLINIEGTMTFCEDLGVDPADVILLALAYELQSPRMGEWPRKGWVDGLKSLGVDSISGIQDVLPSLRSKLTSNPKYFEKVYQHTFQFGLSEGQRSLAIDTAKAFWEILLPAGLSGGALSHISSTNDEDDYAMQSDDNGQATWTAKHTQWWFDFLTQKGEKGVSKDTWNMFRLFVRTIDPKFASYNVEEAWPSTVDSFVEYAQELVAKEGE